MTADDIYNIWKVINGDQILDKEESKSLHLWSVKLEESSNLTCSIPQEEDGIHGRGQMIGFTVPSSKEVLKHSQTILLDATHGTNKDGHYLYTLLSPDSCTGKGIPLAHLISSRKNAESVKFWLESLRAQFPAWMGPQSFLVDCDLAQIAALREVFPRGAVLLCWWHVKKAWSENLGKVLFEANHDGAS